MLDAIGVESIDELFADIPAALRLDRALELPDGLSESEVFDHLAALAARNADADSEICFIGAGMYDHYVPALVDAIISRSEFLTPYTPYQPEVSQGGLQVMFEFQTAISELTGLAGRERVAVRGPVVGRLRRATWRSAPARAASAWSSRAGCTRTRAATLETYARGFGAEVVEVGLRDGLTDAAELAEATRRRRRRGLRREPELPRRRSRTSESLAAAAHGADALCVASVDATDARRPAPARRVRGRHRGGRGPAARQPPRLRRPVVRILRRDRGASAPHARPDRRRDHRRRRPPRLRARRCRPASSTSAARRRPTTSAPAQALNALAGDDLPGLARPPRDRRAGRAAGPAHRLRARAPRGGRRGRVASRGAGRARVRDPPRRARSPRSSTWSPPRASPRATRWRAITPSTRTGCWSRSPSAARRPTSTGSPRRSAPRSRGERRAASARRSRHDGAPTGDGRDPDPAAARPGGDDLRALGRGPARRARSRRPTSPSAPLDELIPAKLLRERRPRLPEVSEPEIVRHYNRLSRRNFDLDTGPYPLGSCTMKHNPQLNERVAALPGHARLHPAQDPKRAQGALELMWNLERALAEITGLPHVSLQPSAGSHGELAGLLLTRAYHEDRGEQRDQGPHARHRARHQPGERDDGGLRGRQGRDRRARRRRPRRPAREGRRPTSPA